MLRQRIRSFGLRKEVWRQRSPPGRQTGRYSPDKGTDGQGFEPWLPFGKHAFQACALDHSATHPNQLMLLLRIVLTLLTKDHEQEQEG